MKSGLAIPLFLGLLLSVCAMERSSAQGSPDQPNILLIVAEELGYSDIAAFGGEIPTPKLDLLAREGMRFAKFHSVGAADASQASILTGLYPHQTGLGAGSKTMLGAEGEVLSTYQGQLNQSCITLAEVLTKNSYISFFAGDWLLGNHPDTRAEDRGFSKVLGLGDFGEGFGSLEEFVAEQVAEAAEADAPYFGFISLPAYRKLSPPAPYKSLADLYQEGWEAARQARVARLDSIGLLPARPQLVAATDQVEGLASWEDMDGKERSEALDYMLSYAAYVRSLDRLIGAIIKKLHVEQQHGNTLILFLTASGASAEEDSPTARAWATLSNTPFRSFAGTSFQGATASPLIAWWPGTIPQGTINGSFTGHVIDLMPTLLQVAGANYPAVYEGRDILPPKGLGILALFQGREAKRKSPLFWEYRGHKALWALDYKLVFEPQQEGWQMFHLGSDPSESQDLYPEKQTYGDIFIRQLGKWEEDMGIEPWDSLSPAP